SVAHGKFSPYTHFDQKKFLCKEEAINPNQQRWKPLAPPTDPVDFIDGLEPFLRNGSPQNSGSIVYLYSASSSMKGRCFSSADGDFLIVPQDGSLLVTTEFGKLEISPSEIIVIPRGIKFFIELLSSHATGYAIENFGEPFEIPSLGPIGANGLANPRHFFAPVAHFEKASTPFVWVHKFQDHLYKADLDHNPMNVVAWYGNYYPYKYDLKLFNTIGTVSFDHPDPSIFTVLTSPTQTPGLANVDFVIFPERWMVAEGTFRPPYYHRNIMSEYMGLITGMYDAKSDGFVPGGGSLHNAYSAHGPDKNTYQKAISETLKPVKQEGTLAFMFESSQVFKPTQNPTLDDLEDTKYQDCWKGLEMADF
ncbi:MAG: homogentisate 1,2-dioxygenase, partial [Bdellovibrionales bacterium]|nr:homogentisate 1,2-dioxygenase [Bdellovibrionales bacterium]